MADVSLATLRTDRHLGDALSLSALRRLDGQPLVRFLAAQRWFGAKGQAGLDAKFADVVPVFAGDFAAAIGRVDVFADGKKLATYQLPLVVRRESGALPIGTALADVVAGADRGTLADAASDADFRARLIRAIAANERFEHAGTRWIAESRAPGVPEPETPSHVLGGEQSNTSILYGERAILKLYRRLTPGPNPDAEIAEFLAARGFRHIPKLLGLVRIEDADGSQTITGILQEFVASIGDGWTYARRRIHDLVLAPDVKQAGRTAFLDDCRRLGEITAELHRALSSDTTSESFAPEPVTGDDLARWDDDVRRQIDLTTALLESRLRPASIRGGSAAEAAAVLSGAESLRERASGFLRSVSGAAGARIRHHGDYHLGQVLRRPSGEYVILDFEGEPARPLADRRQRHSPLRDVAGMLRSFSYATAVTVAEELHGQRDPALELEAAGLAAEMCAAFRGAYFAAAPPPPVLPADGAIRDGLLSVFQIEKAFYEVAYELNNRPEWVYIPLAGIRALLADAPADATRRLGPATG
jgi:trehalose synthase-fused probable maltokinase